MLHSRKHCLLLLVTLFLGIGCQNNALADPTPTPVGAAYFILSDEDPNTFIRYDFTTGQQTPLLSVPDQGWLTAADLNPTGEQFVIAYAPPPAGQTVFGFTRLFLMPNNPNADLELLIEPDSNQDLFFHPIWSPDGRFIYYAHTAFSQTTVDNLTSYAYVTHLKRIEVITGAITNLAADASWPQISSDGEKLVYVQAESDTALDTLILADSDGRHPQTLIDAGHFEAIDAPVFSPDGQWIYFSAAAAAETVSQNVWGVKTAYAHDMAANWYRLSLTTSPAEPERLTTMAARNLYGRFSPRDPHLFAFASDAGLYLMMADGSQLQPLLQTPLLNSLIWQ